MKKTSLLVTTAVFLIGGAGVTAAWAQPYDPQSVSAIEQRFQDIEAEVRRLTAQVEEQSHEIHVLKDELARVSGDLQVQINDMGQGKQGAAGNVGSEGTGSVSYPNQADDMAGGAGTDSSTVQQATPVAKQDHSQNFSYSSQNGQVSGGDGSLGTLNVSGTTHAPTPGNGDPAVSAYDYAYSYVKARNFDRAEQEFSKFIENFPESDLVPNARYWYAETFYVRGNYAQAAKLFAEGYQKDPKGGKAAGNLLKLGMSLAGLGRNDDACVAFKQLQKEYAGTSAPTLNRGKTEMQKINCH